VPCLGEGEDEGEGEGDGEADGDVAADGDDDGARVEGLGGCGAVSWVGLDPSSGAEGVGVPFP
jgi:hypothetical protein